MITSYWCVLLIHTQKRNVYVYMYVNTFRNTNNLPRDRVFFVIYKCSPSSDINSMPFPNFYRDHLFVRDHFSSLLLRDHFLFNMGAISGLGSFEAQFGDRLPFVIICGARIIFGAVQSSGEIAWNNYFITQS